MNLLEISAKDGLEYLQSDKFKLLTTFSRNNELVPSLYDCSGIASLYELNVCRSWAVPIVVPKCVLNSYSYSYDLLNLIKLKWTSNTLINYFIFAHNKHLSSYFRLFYILDSTIFSHDQKLDFLDFYGFDCSRIEEIISKGPIYSYLYEPTLLWFANLIKLKIFDEDISLKLIKPAILRNLEPESPRVRPRPIHDPVKSIKLVLPTELNKHADLVEKFKEDVCRQHYSLSPDLLKKVP